MIAGGLKVTVVGALFLLAVDLAGYEDINDAERLSHDPTFRLIGSEQLFGGATNFASTASILPLAFTRIEMVDPPKRGSTSVTSRRRPHPS